MNTISLPEYFYFDEDDYWFPYDIEKTFDEYAKVIKRYVLMKYHLEVQVSFDGGFSLSDLDLETNEIYELEKLLEKHRSIMKYFEDGKRKKRKFLLKGGVSYTLPF